MLFYPQAGEDLEEDEEDGEEEGVIIHQEPSAERRVSSEADERQPLLERRSRSRRRRYSIAENGEATVTQAALMVRRGFTCLALNLTLISWPASQSVHWHRSAISRESVSKNYFSTPSSKDSAALQVLQWRSFVLGCVHLLCRPHLFAFFPPPCQDKGGGSW
jgi:hypothetical protein